MKTRIIQIAIAIGLISLMTFLFIKTNAVKTDAHNRFSQHLHHLIELDATMDRDVLESRYGLLTTYDSLTSEADELRFLQNELKGVPEFLAPEERDKIGKFLNDFRDLQEQKQQLIEQFKSRNAILNNSLRYFPLAATSILKQVDGPERKELEPVDDLLRETLTFYLLNDQNLGPAIAKRIEDLQRFDNKNSSIVGKTDLQILISHGRTILKLKPEVDDLVKQIAAIPTSHTVEGLIGYYDSSYDGSLQQAETYRLLLYVLSVVLLAYVGFIFVKLRKATSELNVINDSLEQRVQARTEQLSRAEAESRTIAEISQGISTTSNMDELLRHIHSSLRNLVYAENCFVALYDAKTETLGMEFFIDEIDPAPAIAGRLGKGMTAHVLRIGHPLLLTLEDIQRLIADGEIEMVGTAPAVWLGVPLRTPNGVIGVLVVQHYNDKDVYGQRDLDLLSSVGDQIAIAIERKRADEALKASEARFLSAFDYAPIGIGLVTLDGKWLQANRSLCDIVGYTREELLTISFADITHPDDLTASFENNQRLLNGETKACQLEKRYIHKLGHSVLVSASLSLVRDANNDPLYIIAQIQDITEQKSLEEKVQRGQKLESIGQLAAGIAHEINTPTQYVGDNVRFLKDSFQDFMSVFEKTEEMVKTCKSENVVPDIIADLESTIERADIEYLAEEVPKAFVQALDGVERIRKIVQSMKDFAHPGSTHMQFTDLNKAIESTLTVASNEWKYLADVVTNYDESLPAVPCLAGEFNQVVLNIIVNAAHAISDTIAEGSNDKGKINISTRRNGDFAEIRIADSGPGIPEDIRKKIFDPFFTTKAVGKGTGQGLAISHTVIVEKHKGTINVESEVGKGTTFVICLPILDKTPAI